MRVYDLFPFFNEMALLDLRMAELGPIVDVFGAVEIPRTFTDLPKQLWLTDTITFEGPIPKLRVYVPPAYPSGPHPTIDWFQRAQLPKLMHDAEPDDIVMVSDVDEIPNRDVVARLIEAGIDEPLCLQSKLYYHRVDLYDPSAPWSGTIIAPRRCIGDTQELRQRRGFLPQIPDAGWHFSWLGDASAIADKLEAVDIDRESAIYGSGGIVAPPNDRRFLQECYETGKDMFGRPRNRKVRVPIIPGTNQPHEIVEWLRKYPQYAAMDTVPY